MNTYQRSAARLCLALLLGISFAAAADDGAAHDQHHAPAPKAGQATRTIEIVMSDDMRFTPDRIEVKQGEVVRLAVRNAGQFPHEMVIGSERELKAHAAEMAKSGDMAHDDGNALRVAPGATGEIVWNFKRVGSLRFACLVPGHLEAGMTGAIAVAPARSSKGKS